MTEASRGTRRRSVMALRAAPPAPTAGRAASMISLLLLSAVLPSLLLLPTAAAATRRLAPGFVARPRPLQIPERVIFGGGGGAGVPPPGRRSTVGTATSISTSRSGSTSLRMGIVGATARRVRDSVLSRDRSREELTSGIAGFYDRSSKLWEDVWGEHMHHGFYVPPDRTDHQQAQVDLIDEVLKWADVPDAGVKRAVDVGCGIGGSSRHISRKYGCNTEGITLSPYQAGRGNELADEQGLQDKCHFQVANALDMPFDDNSFDLTWSLESGEHMPDKPKFVDELIRVTAPGGRIIIVTWCHRDLEEGEASLSKKELRLLRRINRAYYLPQWCSVRDYVDLLEERGAENIKREDWSEFIAPFWKAVIKSSLNMRSLVGLLRSGFSTQRGAYAMFLMLRGFDMGLIKFGLVTATKKQ